MHSPGTYEQLLRGGGVKGNPIHFKLHHALDDHHEFIGVVHVTFPALVGWIDPEVTAEATLMPVLPDAFDIWDCHS